MITRKQLRDFRKRIQDNAGVRKLVQTWNDNPVLVITAGAGAVAATAKLIDAVSGVRSRKAYARRMDSRDYSGRLRRRR